MTTESNMFEFYNPNPYEKNVGDCTVRAISKALEQDWYRTYLGLCIEGAVRGDMPSANATNGTYILALSGHVVCLQDGVIYDTWHSEHETVLYYWQKG